VEGLRLLTPGEQTASTMFDEHIISNPKKHRWHCSQCGRWVPFPTVRKVPPHGPDWYDEHVYTGECKTHGRVDVTWPEA
jgi:hypothetical protein